MIQRSPRERPVTGPAAHLVQLGMTSRYGPGEWTKMSGPTHGKGPAWVSGGLFRSGGRNLSRGRQSPRRHHFHHFATLMVAGLLSGCFTLPEDPDLGHGVEVQNETEFALHFRIW